MSNSLAEALQKAGFNQNVDAGSTPQLSNDKPLAMRSGTPARLVEFKWDTLSDEQVSAALGSLLFDAEEIEKRLAEVGQEAVAQAWFRRASDALQHIKRRAAAAKQVLGYRENLRKRSAAETGRALALTRHQEREQEKEANHRRQMETMATIAKLKLESKEALALAHAERERERKKAQKTAHALFVSAFKCMYSADAFVAVWARARTDNPDEECWKPAQSLKPAVSPITQPLKVATRPEPDQLHYWEWDPEYGVCCAQCDIEIHDDRHDDLCSERPRRVINA